GAGGAAARRAADRLLDRPVRIVRRGIVRGADTAGVGGVDDGLLGGSGARGEHQVAVVLAAGQLDEPDLARREAVGRGEVAGRQPLHGQAAEEAGVGEQEPVGEALLLADGDLAVAPPDARAPLAPGLYRDDARRVITPVE